MLEDDFTWVLKKALAGNGLAPSEAAVRAGIDAEAANALPAARARFQRYLAAQRPAPVEVRAVASRPGRFERLFGGPPRRPDEPITRREMDLAASIQRVTEDIMLRAARHVHEQTRLRNLCLAGGVALNCVGNGRLLSEGPFERIWIQPAAGDAGGALGVALWIWHQLLGAPRRGEPSDAQGGSLLGPAFRAADIQAFLDAAGAVYRRFDDPAALCRHVAERLASGEVVGWFQGRMEFGPRALGARSILADARRVEMQSLLNLKIKFRESFRPFAPAVLRDRANEYFDLPRGCESPYMLLVAPVAASQRLDGGAARREDAAARFGESSAIAPTAPPAELPAAAPADPRPEDWLARLGTPRTTIPGVTHVDATARVQTVDPARHGRFHALVEAFARLTGCPVLINTSFNVRGEPIVCAPREAYECFLATNMDALVLEDFVLVKSQQPRAAAHPIDEHLARFDPD